MLSTAHLEALRHYAEREKQLANPFGTVVVFIQADVLLELLDRLAAAEADFAADEETSPGKKNPSGGQQ